MDGEDGGPRKAMARASIGYFGRLLGSILIPEILVQTNFDVQIGSMAFLRGPGGNGKEGGDEEEKHSSCIFYALAFAFRYCLL
ncbi:hypothetical protein PRIPAC_72716 [Pristionchus pacificus]|uniref:Uncharacterized protein n=1 Tax=Pristionchus pacificus TaxID=54126 RepID=A0A2A6BZR5_PRIPA|nr:hypothetical protein PRIPAC_72716 [Pristionchus pacificus]|eukprot:PDM71388.1 hypothetical protein PRIPAC_37795 [Pristionchus pacificus]